MLGLHTPRRRKAALAIATVGSLIGLCASPAFAAGETAQAEASSARGEGALFQNVAGLLETDTCKARYANGNLTRNNDQCTSSLAVNPAQAVTRNAIARSNSTSSAEGGIAGLPMNGQAPLPLGQLDLTQIYTQLQNTPVAASALGPIIAQLADALEPVANALLPAIDAALDPLLAQLANNLPLSLEVGAVIARCEASPARAEASSSIADVTLNVEIPNVQVVPVAFETPVESHSDLVADSPDQLADGILDGLQDSLLDPVNAGVLDPILLALNTLVGTTRETLVTPLLAQLKATLLPALSDALAPLVRGEVNHVSTPAHDDHEAGPWVDEGSANRIPEIDLTALSLTVLNDQTLFLGQVHCGPNTAGTSVTPPPPDEDDDGDDEGDDGDGDDGDGDDGDGPKSVDSGLNDGGNLGALAITGLLAASTLVGSAARQRLLLER